jgi:hypothetical protein
MNHLCYIVSVVGIVFALIASFIRNRWGYSRAELFRKSPAELFLERWVGNFVRYFLGYCFIIFVLWEILSGNLWSK